MESETLNIIIEIVLPYIAISDVKAMAHPISWPKELSILPNKILEFLLKHTM